MSSKSGKSSGQNDDDHVSELDAKAFDDADKTGDDDKAKVGDELIANRAAEEEVFNKKWAGPLILGPFVPALLAILIILSGQIVLYTYSGTCNYPLPSFISAAISICYLFLLVYSWVFIGDRIRVKIDILQIDREVFTPFSSLKWLMGAYIVLGVASFITWLVGSVILQIGWFCKSTSPGLYSYVTFLITVYWMAFIIVVLYIIKQIFGKEILGLIREQISAPTLEQVEERIFKRKFFDVDKEKSGVINRDDMPRLLTGLGVYVPSEEMPPLLRSLDPDDSGLVKYADALVWFKKLNAQAEAEEQDDKGGAGAKSSSGKEKSDKKGGGKEKDKKNNEDAEPEEDDGLL